MKIIEIIKNYEDKEAHAVLLKGQKYEVIAWKAEQLLKLGVAKLVYKDIETNMIVNFEKR